MAKALGYDDLHGYQIRNANLIWDEPNIGLFMRMGMGKTATVLTGLDRLLKYCMVNHVLIIAPKRVAFHTWPEELDKWSHVDVSFTQIKGTPEQRWRALTEPSPLKIINRDLVKWLVDYYGITHWPFDMVIIDESSSFKNHASNRFKSLKRVLKKITRMVIMTGTPSPNGLIDLWSQVYLLDEGRRLGTGITKYRNRFFQKSWDGFSYKLRPGCDVDIQNAIGDICVTLTPDEEVTLPEYTENIIRVTLPPKARKMYDELEKEFVVEIDQYFEDLSTAKKNLRAFVSAYDNPAISIEQDEEYQRLQNALDGVIAACNAGVLANKLIQMASGSVYYQSDDGERYTEDIHNAKLDALDEIIEGAAGEPVLIGYSYKHERARIMKRFKHAVPLDDNPATIDKWNRGEIQQLIMHPASGGHGLNLQKGGSIFVWFSLPWSLELYEQFNARLHRQGQKNPVIGHHIVADKTADDTVLNALRGKEVTQNNLMEALRRDIQDE